MEKLQFAFGKGQSEVALEAMEALRQAGYDVIETHGEIDPDQIVLLLLSKGMTKDGLLEIKWLREQFEFCSYPHLRMMPFVAYHSKTEDFDELWDETIGDVYDELISGEFKPYGWDLDDPKSKIEFERVLGDYDE